MQVELITKDELQKFKDEILAELRHVQAVKEQVKLLKSAEVKKFLGCSDGTLQKHRISGRLACTKIGGTYYYNISELEKLLNKSLIKHN